MTLLEPLPALAPLARWDVGLDELVAAKAGLQIAVCIPARDEAATIGRVVAVVDRLRDSGLVDQLLVVDDGSVDDTARCAEAAGATVMTCSLGPGKGQALSAAVEATDAEILVFLDADVTNFSERFVTALLEPLLADESLQLVKAAYRRPLRGRADEGGRVTELLARPLLRHFFPELSVVSQPLAGESGFRRQALDDLGLAAGYGIEIGLLIDVYRRYGLNAIAEVDLGERIHRNRPLHQLQHHADDVLAATLQRAQPYVPEPGER